MKTKKRHNVKKNQKAIKVNYWKDIFFQAASTTFFFTLLNIGVYVMLYGLKQEGVYKKEITSVYALPVLGQWAIVIHISSAILAIMFILKGGICFKENYPRK